ncbi:hypothetical protein SNE40_013367 [Patella caerulea]|uniref:Reverse transcriptase domain-containing protein n=1 Tax=Patella caerulea TaxID=87958 RepID=A0AAN8PHE6_PATCE
MHMYADDTQLYDSFGKGNCAAVLHNLEDCLESVREWMVTNHLKLNDAKTEFMVVGNARQRHPMSIKIGSAIVAEKTSAQNIGVILDNSLTLSEHINSVTHSCYQQLRKIGQSRAYLTEEATSSLVRCLILSKLDYANALFYGLPDYLLNKLQTVQNCAAKLVKRKKKYDHVTPLLRDLHWLPVQYRIIFKINMMTYKALHNKAPDYIKEMIIKYNPNRNLRSTSHNLLTEKRSKLKRSGDRAFSVSAPKLWNVLPETIRLSKTMDIFKTKLKTHLYNQAYQ